MRDRALLLLYLAAVTAATLVHDPRALGAALVVVLASAGRRRAGPLAWRALRASLPFVAAVAAGWLVVLAAGRQAPGAGAVPGHIAVTTAATAGAALLRLALRVTLLTALAFRVLPSLSLARALAFSATLRFVLVLALSQVLAFRRLFGDFRLALESRSPRRVGPRLALRHGAMTAAWFLRRAEHDATTLTQALDARGFFLDRD
jgi:hypothetical protein